jgi:hypothetical protein
VLKSEYPWADLLVDLTKDSGNYAVYELGLHPSATHVFALGRANSIVDLHPDTPMIYLNFAQVDMLQCRPHDKRRPSALFAATHGKSKSIYILNPVPDDLDELPHDYFVLPSEALATEDRKEVSKAQLKPRPKNAAQKASRRATWITLKNDEPLLVYRVARSRLEASLLRIFQQPLNRESLLLGDAKTDQGTRIRLEKYIRTQRAVISEYITLMNGESYFGRGERPFDAIFDDDEGEDDVHIGPA